MFYNKIEANGDLQKRQSFLPLHGVLLQETISVVGPNSLQFFPCPEGAGFVHFLSLICVPLPQVVEQGVTTFQFDKPPSRPVGKINVHYIQY